MAFGLTRPFELDEVTRLELEQLVGSLQSYLGVEHGPQGQHRRIAGRWTLMANQSIPDASWTRVAVTVPHARNAGDLSVNAVGVVTINTPGQYLVVGSIRWASGATGLRAAAIIHQRSFASIGMGDVSAANSWSQATECLPCERGETIELHGFQSSGGAKNAEPSETFLRVARVGG